MKNPVRFRNETSMTVEIVAQGPSTMHANREMLFLIITNQFGGKSTGCANLDGTNPNQIKHRDLIEVNTDVAAHHVQMVLHQHLFTACRTLWQGGFTDQVLEITTFDTNIHVQDMALYLKCLWG